MKNAPELKTVEEAVSVGTRRGQYWFRGHAINCGELTPKIFRSQYAALRERDRYFECKLIREFKRMGVTMTPNPPRMNDQLRWLFLMQHHGAPTRLLDWTENVLVAAYFAVEDKPGRDGELWVLQPLALNKTHELDSVPCADEVDTNLRLLLRQPCHPLTPEDLQRIRFPYAIRPAMHVPRMMSQLGVFTIHPTPADGSAGGIAESLADTDTLARYIIPRACKRKMCRDLAALGITRRTLFGDLDALAATVVTTLRDAGSSSD